MAPPLKYLFPKLKLMSVYKHIKQILSVPKVETIDDIKIFRLFRFHLPYNKLFYKYDLKVLSYFNKKKIYKIILRMKPDIIIVSGFHPEGSFAAHYIKSKFNIPTICFLEGSEVLISAIKYDLKRQIFKEVDKNDMIIYVSESFRKQVEAYFRFKKTKVLPNAYDEKVFKFDPKKRSQSDEKLIVSVGGLNFIKGHDILLSALKNIRIKYKLFIIGTGEKYDAYHYYVLKNSLNVELLGDRTPPEISKILNYADLFCMPSRSESFGIAAIESMACGVPVVGAKVGGLKDLIIDGFNGYLFEPENELDLVEKINKAFETEWDRGKIAEWAYQNYSYKIWCQKFNDIIKEITVR